MAAVARFQEQVDHYGGWEKLQHDTARFQEVNRIVQEACADVPVWENGPEINPCVVTRKRVCLVAQYRRLGLGARFGEV